jgi:two-component system, chemotaxis family, chemotaxis protein CheY
MLRYLVVEDDEMSREMLCRFLSRFAKCDSADNGKSGFDMFNSALSDGQPYDHLFIDLVMPVMNGLALVRKIREVEKMNPIFNDCRTKVSVLTSSTCLWDKADLVLDNLCDDYIVKPFVKSELAAKLQLQAKAKRHAVTESGSPLQSGATDIDEVIESNCA